MYNHWSTADSTCSEMRHGSPFTHTQAFDDCTQAQLSHRRLVMRACMLDTDLSSPSTEDDSHKIVLTS